MATPHVVLLGDSTLDNAAYVAGGRDVAALVREELGAGARVTLLAVDGKPSSSSSSGQCHVPVQPVVAKLGFPSATGRLDFRRGDGAGLVQWVRVLPHVTYPDGGCPIELWLQHPLVEPLQEFGGLHPDADLVELETLSPLRELEPGQSVVHHVEWRCSAPRR